MGKMMNGLLAGAVVGATIGMAVVPQLDRKTRKRIQRTGKRVFSAAEDAYDSVKGRMGHMW